MLTANTRAIAAGVRSHLHLPGQFIFFPLRNSLKRVNMVFETGILIRQDDTQIYICGTFRKERA